MSLIRFESDDHDLSKDQIQTLQSARDRFVRDHQVDFDDDANRCARLPDQLSFYALPEQQLLAYEKHRESSELGHIFRIANGLHDHVDALVVNGSGGGWSGAKAIATACCDPYHNELSRAARGSKPRIYFVDHELDNDQLRSLLGRLQAGGYGDAAGEQGWALIAIESRPASHPSSMVLRHLMAALERQPFELQPDGSDFECRSRLVTTIGPAALHSTISEPESAAERYLRVPDSIDGALSVLSPVGLLAAAFLGFDCIQLLVGAAAINTNFASEPFHKNIVLRFVAARQSTPCNLFAWWARSLYGVSEWLAALHSAAPFLDPACENDRENFLQALETGRLRSDQWSCHHVGVDAIRTDPLPADPKESVDARSGDRSVTAYKHQIESRTMERFAAMGIRQNRLVLPEIDSHALGQLLQLLMLANAIERTGQKMGV